MQVCVFWVALFVLLAEYGAHVVIRVEPVAGLAEGKLLVVTTVPPEIAVVPVQVDEKKHPCWSTYVLQVPGNV